MIWKIRGAIIIVIFAMTILIVYSLVPYYRDQTSSHPTLGLVRSNFTRLNPRYGKIPLRAGDSAYTENKEVITLCLVDPDTNHFYDINTIMYVALHELAHVIT